jgi:hypothetical protein
MNTPRATDRHKNHRFPLEIVSLAVWLYFRFRLSCRAKEYRSSRALGVTALTAAAKDSPTYCRRRTRFQQQVASRRPRSWTAIRTVYSVLWNTATRQSPLRRRRGPQNLSKDPGRGGDFALGDEMDFSILSRLPLRTPLGAAVAYHTSNDIHRHVMDRVAPPRYRLEPPTHGLSQ